MILIGTIVGKIYVFDYNKQTVEGRMLEAQKDNSIRYLSFDSESEQNLVFATKKGMIGKNNIYDVFDSREIDTQIPDVVSADYNFNANTLVLGTEQGNIHSFNFDHTDDKT